MVFGGGLHIQLQASQVTVSLQMKQRLSAISKMQGLLVDIQGMGKEWLFLDTIDDRTGHSFRSLATEALRNAQPLTFVRVVNNSSVGEEVQYYSAEGFHQKYLIDYPITVEKITNFLRANHWLIDLHYLIYDISSCGGQKIPMEFIHVFDLLKGDDRSACWCAWINVYQNSNLLVKMEAYMQLGEMYSQGGMIESNFVIVENCWKKAVEQTVNLAVQAAAWYHFGKMYLFNSDLKQAAICFAYVANQTADANIAQEAKKQLQKMGISV